MTREEAIKKLQRQKAEYLDEWVDFSGIAEAFDMAIQALKSLNKLDKTITEQIDISYDQVECQTLRWVLDKMSEEEE